MKRKLQDDEIGNEIHMGEAVKKELRLQKRPVAWLAEEIGHDTSNLHEQLKSSYIHPRWLFEISKVLKKNFFSLYSRHLGFD